MRKLSIFNMISLDGFFEGPNRDINWHIVDEEFNQFAIDQLKTVDTLLFGRVTYELMAGYWPTPDAIENDPVIAKWMNQMDKIVFSKTLKSAEWQNSRLIRENAAAEIKKLKQQPGKEMIIFGSSDLALSLLPEKVIDEFRFMVNPIMIGRGKTMFQGLHDQFQLRLVDTRAMQSGNVLLYYQPV